MNPTEKGWLKDYFEILLHDISQFKEWESKRRITDSEEEVMYALLQPSGLLYGHPVNFPYFQLDITEGWEDKDKMKVLLADSFLSSGLLVQTKRFKRKKQYRKLFVKLFKNVAQYYSELFPHIFK